MGLLKGIVKMPVKHPIASLGLVGTGASIAAGVKPAEELEGEIMKNYTAKNLNRLLGQFLGVIQFGVDKLTSSLKEKYIQKPNTTSSMINET